MRIDKKFSCCNAILVCPDSSDIKEIEELVEKALTKLPIEIIAYFKEKGMQYHSGECLCSCLADITEWEGNDILFLKPLDGYKISRITIRDKMDVQFMGEDRRKEKYILLGYYGSTIMVSMESDTERELRKSKEKIEKLKRLLEQQENLFGRIEDQREWETTFTAMSKMSPEGHGRQMELLKRINKQQKEVSKLLKGKSPEELKEIVRIIKENTTGK